MPKIAFPPNKKLTLNVKLTKAANQHAKEEIREETLLPMQ